MEHQAGKEGKRERSIRRGSTMLALAAVVIAVLWGLTASCDNTSRSDMMARRYLQEDNDDLGPIDEPIPVAGIRVYNDSDGASVVPTPNQREVTEKLEEDQQVTVLSSIQLGALSCESLPAAENAPTLKFDVQVNQTIIAEETSFSSVPGAILPDGVTRFSWTGVVIDPEPSANHSEPSTVSMSWGEDCTAENFLWKQTTRLLDGTTVVLKSIPCEAGEADDVCVVEVSLDLAEESDPENEVTNFTTSSSITTSDAGRRLRGRSNSMATAGVDRNLQDEVTVTVAMLYSEAALVLLGNVTPAQMVTTIVDAIASSNLALKNSQVPMVFQLAYVGKVPYTPKNISHDALPELRDNEDVINLRDLYQADLVQLVGALDDSCGRGDVYYPGKEPSRASVVSPNCIDGFSHTHELGHNLGCHHNRASTTSSTEYSHGLRYCDTEMAEEERYHTIMSYDCRDTNSTRINLFSNPDISYLGKPTGTATENNARSIIDNMVEVSTWNELPASLPPTPTPATVAPSATAPPSPAPTTQAPSATMPPTPAPTTAAPSVTVLPTPAPTTQAPSATMPPTSSPTTPAPTPAPVDILDGYTGGECYADSPLDRVLSGPSFGRDPEMTIEKCAGLCDGARSAFFGVEFGQECFCSAIGDDPSERAKSSACSFTCTGDASQTCGGIDAINVYEFDKGYEYDVLGCFEDDSATPVLSGPSKKNDSSMTTAVCAAFCGDALYFGTEFGVECFCGVEGDTPDALGEATCDMDCAGDSSETCGGSNAISVYINDVSIELIESVSTDDRDAAVTITDDASSDDSSDDSSEDSVDLSDAATIPAYASSDNTLDLSDAATITVYANSDNIIDFSDATPRGCWTDVSSSRLFGVMDASDVGMTTEMCESTCLGSLFFGTQFGTECWCGDDPDYERHGNSPDCDMPCAGDAGETCGGEYAMNVYEY